MASNAGAYLGSKLPASFMIQEREHAHFQFLDSLD
jgi:hypothetical protein